MGCLCTKNNPNTISNIIHKKNFSIYQSTDQQYKLMHDKKLYNILRIHPVKNNFYYIICDQNYCIDFILLHNGNHAYQKNKYMLNIYIYKTHTTIHHTITQKEYQEYNKIMDYLSNKFHDILQHTYHF